MLSVVEVHSCAVGRRFSKHFFFFIFLLLAESSMRDSAGKTWTTERYLHVSKKQLVNIISPLDDLWVKGKIDW
jgi:hypothetical protein